MEWHKIISHCNFNNLRKLQSIVDGMKIADDQQCECAHKGKCANFGTASQIKEQRTL